MQGAWATRQERAHPRPWRKHGVLAAGVRGWGVPVAESVLAPPGPIPNPVVTQRSAGEYCGGDPTGGEAAAGTPHPRVAVGQNEKRGKPRANSTRRGVEQRQLVGLITQRSGVRIPPPATRYQKATEQYCSVAFCCF